MMISEITPFQRHGKLSVRDGRLIDKNGSPVRLFGMSSHGIAWYPQFLSLDSMQTLRDEWRTNCFRAALYTHEYGGYCTGGDREQLKEKIFTAAEYARQLGMYLIIDWHVLGERSPNVYKYEAMDFFEEICAKFADRDDILYEICNEPNRSADWPDICAYAEDIVPLIRRFTDAVVIVGTPMWCQEIDRPLYMQLHEENIMYAFHFYSASHKQPMRDKLEFCVNEGLPVFISEFGVTDAAGGGYIDYEETEEWFGLIERLGLSCINWNLSNGGQLCSAIDRDCTRLSHWHEADLTESGRLAREFFIRLSEL